MFWKRLFYFVHCVNKVCPAKDLFVFYKMKTIFTIFKKEMLDTLRDRRTLFIMIIVPLLLLPMIFTVMGMVQSSQHEEAMNKTIRVAITDNNNGAELLQTIQRRRDVQVVPNENREEIRKMIREDALDLALEISPSFDESIAAGKTGELTIYYNSTSDSLVYSALDKTIQNYHKNILAQRLEVLGATTATIKPTKIIRKDVYTRTESLGKMIGGFLPYVFVLFCMMGAMYPAIDLFTGEKERGTIETILTIPADRLQILLGKMAVVVLGGVCSGLLTIVGMYLALQLGMGIPDFIRNIVLSILTPKSIFLVLLMLFPLTVFFAGVLIPISVYARSFKEAQSMIQPMMFLVFIPLIIGMVPGIELSRTTAIVPILNVALASREIVAGTIDFSLLSVVYLSLFSFAALAILICVKWFEKEGNVLR